jgi:hypothetical protein
MPHVASFGLVCSLQAAIPKSRGNISFRLRRSRDNPLAKPLPMTKSAAGTRFVAASLSIIPRLLVIAHGGWRVMVQALWKRRGTRPRDVCILPLLFSQPPIQYEERIPYQDSIPRRKQFPQQFAITPIQWIRGWG